MRAQDSHNTRTVRGAEHPNTGFRPGKRQPGTKAREQATPPPTVAPVYRGKTERSEDTPLSTRLLKRGISGPDDAQRYLDALALDVADGLITVKQGHFMLMTLRSKIGVWLQTRAQGKTFDLMPVPPDLEHDMEDEGEIIDADAEVK